MEDTVKDDAKKVYEIGYVLVSSVPVEKVGDVVASLKDILSKKQASIITEEAPGLMDLAYTMIKKIGTIHHRFDQGYFGWMKFDVGADQIEEIKKSFEAHPDMLRMLLITTVRENTYLGKKAPAAELAASGIHLTEGAGDIAGTDTSPATPEEVKADVKPAAEDMDKSIDEMVKEA